MILYNGRSTKQDLQSAGKERQLSICLKLAKEEQVAFKAVFNQHIQLLHDGNDHWLLTFFSNGRGQVCDSLRNTLGFVTHKCVNAPYRKCKDERGKLIVSLFLPVQRPTTMDKNNENNDKFYRKVAFLMFFPFFSIISVQHCSSLSLNSL